MTQAPSFAASAAPDPRSAFASGLAGDAATSTPPATVPTLASRHSPWIAALLAGFPGLGSVYNGSYARGVAFFLAILGAMNLANRSNELWGFAVAFIWLFNMIDAYREARLIRAGLALDLGTQRLRPAPSPAEGLGLGALLLVVGLVSLLDVLGYDVAWTFDLWPLGLIAAGAWFIFAAIRRIRSGPSGEAGPTSFGIDRPSGTIGLDSGSRPEFDSAPTSEPPPHPPQGW